MLLPLIASGLIATAAAPAGLPAHFLLTCAGDNYSHHSGKADFKSEPWSATYDVDLRTGAFFETRLRKPLRIAAVRDEEIALQDRASDGVTDTLSYYPASDLLFGALIIGSPAAGYFTVETRAHCTVSNGPS